MCPKPEVQVPKSIAETPNPKLPMNQGIYSVPSESTPLPQKQTDTVVDESLSYSELKMYNEILQHSILGLQKVIDINKEKDKPKHAYCTILSICIKIDHVVSKIGVSGENSTYLALFLRLITIWQIEYKLESFKAAFLGIIEKVKPLIDDKNFPNNAPCTLYWHYIEMCVFIHEITCFLQRLEPLSNKKSPPIEPTIRTMNSEKIRPDPNYLIHGLVVLGHVQKQETSLTLGNRTLAFADKSSDQRYYKKVTELLRKLLNANNPSLVRFPEKRSPLVNTSRREEVFIPVTIGTLSSYINARTDTPLKQDFYGIKRYVTAGCIAGSAIQAVVRVVRTEENSLDANSVHIEHLTPLINHRLQISPNQKIVEVQMFCDFSLFEIALFEQFQKTCALISATKAPATPILYYHLPYWDYILFGLKLYVDNKMTAEALSDLIKIVWGQKEKHIYKLEQIAKQHHITLFISSPFDNLFAECTPNVSAVLDRLNLDGQQLNEQGLVRRCLYLLRTNTHNPLQQEMWNKYLNKDQKDTEIQDIEGLFRMANGIMLALAADGQPDFTVCAIHPLTEKQIQLSYSHLTKGHENPCKLVYITVIDQVISQIPHSVNQYEPSHQGLAFYIPVTSMTSYPEERVKDCIRKADQMMQHSTPASPSQSRHLFFTTPPASRTSSLELLLKFKQG